MMISSVIFSICLFLSNLFIYSKYKKLKTKIKDFCNIGTGRCGFYESIANYSSYNSIVYIKELDRYTDGHSKIKIDKIEPINKKYLTQANEQANERFLSLRLTSEIKWLESEDYIRKLRKEKLENISSIKYINSNNIIKNKIIDAVLISPNSFCIYFDNFSSLYFFNKILQLSYLKNLL